MARQASKSDLVVDVDGIGRFVFARRTMRDKFGIRGAYAALTSANYDAEGNTADIGALAFCTINHLLVSAPAGFSLEVLDPDADEEKLTKVFLALREQEGSFRKEPAPGVQGGREEPGAEL